MMMRNGTMRDSSTDQETGWLYDGYYDRITPDLSRGFAGGRDSTGDRVAAAIATLPPSGRKYVFEALRDPEAKPIVTKLLTSSWNPADALAKQAEQDLAESVKSTGKVIVFKSLVGKLAGRLKDAQDAMVRASDPNSVEGRTIVGIVATSKNPHADVQEFLTNVAFAALAPDAQFVDIEEDVPHELSGLGKSLLKRIKTAGTLVVQKVESVYKNPTVRKAALAAAVIGAVVITAGAIAPALSATAPAVAGAAGNSFKKPATKQVWDPVRGDNVTVDATTGFPIDPGMSQTSSQTPPPTAGSGINLASVAGIAADIYKVKLTGDIAKAKMLNDQAVAQLKAQGLSDTQAQALVDQGLQQAAESYGPQQAAAAQQYVIPTAGRRSAPAEESMFSPDTVKYGLMAVVGLGTLYGISQVLRGGGGGKSRRRSSRRR